MLACPFCKSQEVLLAENEIALAIKDKHPISMGHALIIPRRHVSSIFVLTLEEYLGCFELVRIVKELLEDSHAPEGFNLLVNNGAAAGQTVEHAHIHVVPRYKDDALRPSPFHPAPLPGT
jgi:diadenosine tetraphosphate (Ap4A) HIT family hydrolase